MATAYLLRKGGQYLLFRNEGNGKRDLHVLKRSESNIDADPIRWLDWLERDLKAADESWSLSPYPVQRDDAVVVARQIVGVVQELTHQGDTQKAIDTVEDMLGHWLQGGGRK